MNNSSISVRYAKALFSLANEKNVLDEVYSDLENLLTLMNTLPQFKVIVDSPVISSNDKQRFLKELLGKSVNDLTHNFLTLLLTNSRENYLPMIARNFIESYREKSGIKSVQLSSAIELDEKVVKQIGEVISKKYNAKVNVLCEVDSKLIGGFVMQVDDQLLDASVATRLKTLRQEFVKAK